jgi:BirA family biotin operon repressor/biotin-[acetyl-CoA-carboxylase] ligase
MLDLEFLREHLPGRRVDWFASIPSTMIEARRDPQPGRIVIADHQTAGMGRHGRVWHSPAGEGLYTSIVLTRQQTPVVTLALGLAVAHALVRAESRLVSTPPPHIDLRWPNDVLLNSRKCAGILAQAEESAIIAGIGINVSQRTFPENLDTPATSLLLEGTETTREALLVSLVEETDNLLSLTSAEIIARFTQASTYARGRRIRAGSVEGVTCGLDPAGFLRVREDNGTETAILAGGVRPI